MVLASIFDGEELPLYMSLEAMSSLHFDTLVLYAMLDRPCVAGAILQTAVQPNETIFFKKM